MKICKGRTAKTNKRMSRKKETYCLKEKKLTLGGNINQRTKRNSSQLIHSAEQHMLINSINKNSIRL